MICIIDRGLSNTCVAHYSGVGRNRLKSLVAHSVSVGRRTDRLRMV